MIINAKMLVKALGHKPHFILVDGHIKSPFDMK